MSIREFHHTLCSASEEARPFKQLRELGVDDLKQVPDRWDPWT